MREITVSAWDDVAYSETGERVPADPSAAVVLSLNGHTVELDLTLEHRDELDLALARWFKAGAKSEGTHRTLSPRQRHPIHSEGLTPLQAARQYNGEMHRWAIEVDPKGEKYKITRGFKGKPYYPERLRTDYAAYLASQAGSGEG